MPAVIGNAAERRTLAEALRAAILTVHAAAGLASCADQQTQRLLRASEGLSRSALAVLLASPPEASLQQPRAPRPDDAPRRRRRPRGRRGDRGQKATAMEEDLTAEPELSGDAPAVDRATAAEASGPASVPTKARAPFLLQPAVGNAGAPEEIDDAWADHLPELRPSSLDAKGVVLGKVSESGAGVALSASFSTASASSGAVQRRVLAKATPPEFVEVRLGSENAWYGRYKFIQHTRLGRTLWLHEETGSFGVFYAAKGLWWVGDDPEGMMTPLVEPRTEPSPSSWS